MVMKCFNMARFAPPAGATRTVRNWELVLPVPAASKGGAVLRRRMRSR
jgi:hypothetical protein